MGDDITSRFGRYVRTLRRARGWTQELLAQRSTLSIDGIRRLEAGAYSPSLGTLVKLSEALGLRLSTMLAALEPGAKAAVRELCDHLENLPARDLRTAARVVYALRDPSRRGPRE